MALPIFFGLKSKYNNKYVQYVKEDVEVHGLLRCSGENLVTPFTKYKTEMAKIGGGLVHIRCCYNNKYLVQRSPSQRWIIAGSDEPVEDMSSWSCTLFKPVPLDCKTIRFRHVQLGHYACLWRTSDAFDLGLFAGSEAEDKDQRDVFTIIDWELLCILPRHVAFKVLGLKSNYNDKYVQYVKEDAEIDGLLRCSGENLVTRYTKYKIEMAKIGGGLVHIKCCYNNKYLVQRSPSQWWIVAGADEPVEDRSRWSCTLFEPVPLDSKTIRFRHVQLGNYACLWTTSDVFDFGLFAGSEAEDEDQRDVFTIIDWESLCMQLATSRNINNVNYHLKDARIYNQSVDLLLASESVVNRTKEPYTFDIKLAYIDSKNKAWNASVWPNWGVKTDINAIVPLITGTKVEISADSTEVFEWEKMIERSNISEAAYKITVPPMTRVKVNLLATEGSCDVPFSYDQRDTLTDGNVVTITMDDGIYTGVNYYNFKYETEEEKL
ncbi:hypothetical protein LguiB_001939 [Lonicera macranthoides]